MGDRNDVGFVVVKGVVPVTGTRVAGDFAAFLKP